MGYEELDDPGTTKPEMFVHAEITNPSAGLQTNNLDHLALTACADTTDPVDMTAEVADDTVLSNITTKGGDTSTFDRRYESLQAIGDKVGGFSGDGGAAQDDSVISSLDLAHTDLDTIIAAGGIGSGVARKSITFDGGTLNAIGDEDGTWDGVVFTVTGDVIVRIIAVCTTDLTFDADATIELGIGGGLEIITTTDLTVAALTAKEIWHDATPDKEIELLSVIKEFIITDGNDITLDCDVANVTGGVIAFTCFYTPISADGAVVAAA